MVSTPPPSSEADHAAPNGHGPTPSPEAHGLKDAFASAVGHLGEMREYASYYATVQADAVKAKVRTIGVYTVLGILGGVVGATMLVVAAARFVGGLAGAVGHWTGYAWLGDLIVGFALLALVGVGTWLGLRVMQSTFKRKLMEKYEQRHQAQRERFGTDVLRRSREEGSERL